MHAGALRALEFDRIVEAVRRFAQTPPGAERLALLEPLAEAPAVAAALAATSETVRFLADNQISLHAPSDLDAIVSSLGVEGRALEAGNLLALGSFLTSVEVTCATIRRARGACPILRAVADASATFDAEISDIRRK